ncbi:hypothetical protein [Cedecea sp.]|jgi:hypothetical protein|uniref:hypothetical protein n=1 Tax=Cedecea sp. TaxID=1970739 RepID=UPI002F41C9BE
MNRYLIATLVAFCLASSWAVDHYHSKYREAQKRADDALKDVDGQRQVIAIQAFNMNRFNQIADHTRRNHSLIDAGAEKTVIEYREILHRDKTCDLPVPADIARGLLDYTARLRTRAMHAAPGVADAARSGAVTAGSLTYCQAVLWIRPLLAAIDKANHQLSGIRDIEKTRAAQ